MAQWILLVKSEPNSEGFAAVAKRLASVGLLKTVCNNAFQVAGAVRKTFIKIQGADFLGRGAFWSIKSSGLLR